MLRAVRTWARRRYGDGVVTGVAAVLAVAGWIAARELDRLTAGVVSPDGSTRTASSLLGPSAWSARDSWQVWHTSPFAALLPRFLALHLVAQAVLLAALTVLVRRWVQATSRVALGAWWVAVAAAAVAGGLALVGTALLAAAPAHPAGPPDAAWSPPWIVPAAVAVAASLAWAAGAVVLVTLLRRGPWRDRTAAGLRRAGRALYYQRLGLAVVALLGLSLVPLPNVFDQLPDVQRAWSDLTARSWTHLSAAAVATLVVAVELFVIGRLRSQRAREHFGRAAVLPLARPSWWWLSGPGAALGMLGVLLVTGHAGDVDAGHLAVVLAVPLVPWGLSWAAYRRWFGLRAGWQVPPPAVADPALARAVRRAGDVLAVAVVAVAGLGLVRSYTIPVVLGPARVRPGQGREFIWGQWVLEVALLAGGIAVAVACVPLSARAVRRIDGGRLPHRLRALDRLRADDSRRVGRLAVAVWCLSALTLALEAVIPFHLADLLGVVATLLLVTGAWAFQLGFLQVRLQRHQPLEVFRWLHLRATPVLSIAVVALLVNGLAGGSAALHELRPAPDSHPGESLGVSQVPIGDALDAWAARSGACDRTVAGPDGAVTVRPLLLVAADGGGIRAAAWTARTLAALADPGLAGPCGAASVFLSSGVSGGSVGLAISRGPAPEAAVTRLADPQPLALAIGGMLVNDLVGDAAGLRIPAYDAPGGARWLDRAGRMEVAWEGRAPVLAGRFSADPAGPGGAVELNSTAAGTGCRALLGQVGLDDETPGAPPAPLTRTQAAPAGLRADPPCRQPDGLPAATFDLQQRYGSCLRPLTWGTAAMLSARFPYVTPSGRVPSCKGDGELQLIDGGYAEGSGVGLLAEAAPALMSAIRAHNAAVRPGSGAYLVPVVVLLRNGNGADLVAPPSSLTPEGLVPVHGMTAAHGLQTDTGTWLQRASNAYADPCPQEAESSTCGAAVESVRGWVPGGTVVVAPATEPAVDSPLGWTLSHESETRLATALTAEQTCAGTASGTAPTQTGRYPRLCTLLALLRDTGPGPLRDTP